MTLEETLKKAAFKVWDELEPIPQTSNYKVFEVREEALTTMAIKELFRSACPEIEKVLMIPGSEESIKGYDFELVIGSKSLGKYVRFFIQAKRLYGKKVESNYNDIDFDQTMKLLNYSKGEDSLAMYLFYNHLVENDCDLMNHFNSATPYDKKCLGITITSAYSVHRLKEKKFSVLHCNNGRRVNPSLYNLRHFTHLFYFHEASKRHIAVPFHELSYFKISLAETINQIYRNLKAQGKLKFFFFFFPGLDELLNGDEDIIPILETNQEVLISQFNQRVNGSNDLEKVYNPQALIIIETGENI